MFEEYFLSPRFVLTYLFAKQKSNWITAISVDGFSIIFNYSNILQFKLKIIVSFFVNRNRIIHKNTKNIKESINSVTV
jgi:hypothetical protein